MPVLYTIVNGVDVSSDSAELSIINRTSISGDTAVFEMADPDNEPISGHSVHIYVDDTSQTIFRGKILTVTQSTKAPDQTATQPKWKFLVNCGSYLNNFNKRLVIEHYEDTIPNIIADIVANYTDTIDGFTANSISWTSALVEDIWFNYRYPSDCLKELAEKVNCQWYIDSDKDIHFFSKATGDTTSSAPRDITDTTLKENFSNFRLTSDNSQVRNHIFVQGGYYQADTITVIKNGDTKARFWTIPYKPHDMTLTVGGVSKTLGRENIDADDGSFAYFYNFYEQTLYCATAEATPGADVSIIMVFDPELPILVNVRSQASKDYIASIEGGDGRYDYIIKDTSGVELKATAFAFGERELNNNAFTVIEGSVTIMDEYGFYAGQKITLNVTGVTYNADYLINQVSIESLGGSILMYNIEFEGLYGQ